MRRFLSILLTLIIFNNFSPKTIAAETAISVSPAILEAVTKTGEEYKTKIVVINTTTFPLPIKGQVSAFLSNTKISEREQDTFNAASWFTLDPADFILQPMEQKEIEVTIIPPKDSEPGGHYATIYFQPLIPQEVMSSQTTVSLSRVGVLAFLIVPGDIHEDLNLASFATKSWQTFGSFDINFTLHNSGNVHIMPRGNIEIKNFLGKVVDTIPLTPNLILPGTDKEYKVSWGKPLDLNFYTTNLSLNYGSNDQVLVSSNQSIFIFPWPLILFAFVLLTLTYNIFIVHIDRVKLAIKVLKGNEINETKNPPQNHRLKSGIDRRIDSAHSRTKRSRSRQSH